MRLTSFGKRLVLAFAAVCALSVWVVAGAAADPNGSGFVFTSTNAAGGNAVLVYSRAADGTLSSAGSVATGGLGTGGGLGSQGALALSREDGRFLFVVNAGDNTISALAVRPNGLRLIGTVPSGGVKPVSLTASDDLLYVLNEGDSGSPGNISGFRIDDGVLSPIAGSTQLLSAASVSAPQIGFDPSGRLLVVTEKATNLIDTYRIGPGGRAQGPITHPSAGQTPFGFAFDTRGDLVVSDAYGGAAGAGALSSYELGESGSLDTISGPTADLQTAPCWVVTTKNSRYAYTTNTGSGTISSYQIGHDGSLALLAAAAGTTGGAPIDMALSRNSHLLYALSSGAIRGFQVQSDGSLTPLATGPSGLPPSSVGLIAS